MKTFLRRSALSVLALGLLLAPLTAPEPVGAQERGATYTIFYEQLQQDGDWRESAEYGYVWQPRVPRDWRPYTLGRWTRTNAGWTWISTERFGWATYHYGRWVQVRGTGWLWVPGDEWAPAWVSFRSSDRYVGWAPLPPEVRAERGREIDVAVDVEYDLGPDLYTFVRIEKFNAPSIREVVVQERENVVIVEETRNVTRIRHTEDVVYVDGPPLEAINRRVSTPFREVRLERRTDVGRASYRAEVTAGVVAVLAPRFVRSESARPARVAGRLDRVEIDRGWADVKDRSAVERVRAKLRAESPEAQKATPRPPGAGGPAPAVTGMPAAPAASATPAAGSTPPPVSAAVPGASPGPKATAGPGSTPPTGAVTPTPPTSPTPRTTPAPSASPRPSGSPVATPPAESPRPSPAPRVTSSPAAPEATGTPRRSRDGETKRVIPTPPDSTPQAGSTPAVTERPRRDGRGTERPEGAAPRSENAQPTPRPPAPAKDSAPAPEATRRPTPERAPKESPKAPAEERRSEPRRETPAKDAAPAPPKEATPAPSKARPSTGEAAPPRREPNAPAKEREPEAGKRGGDEKKRPKPEPTPGA